jgi:hypothetical protein
MPRLSLTPRNVLTGAERHRTAIATTLAWAEASAARGDYADALSWLDVVEATGDHLVDGYEVKRRAWLGALPPAGPKRSAV